MPTKHEPIIIRTKGGQNPYMITAETCVCCGQIIPEGRQVCRMCEISVCGNSRVSGNKLEPMQTTPTNPKNAYIQKAVERLFRSCRNRKHKRIKE